MSEDNHFVAHPEGGIRTVAEANGEEVKEAASEEKTAE